jgi:pilus assembly protein CpaE
VAATPQGAPTPVLPHRLIVITSPKGGVGTSTIAVNLAVALQISGYDTVVVDANLNFTSHSVLLDLVPGRSIADLAGIEDLNRATVLAALSAHPSGLRALLGPEEPEQGDRVLPEDIQAVLGLLQEQFVFTVVDACPCFDGRVLSALEMAHTILVPISPDLPTMKNVNSYLRVIDLLHFDLSKLQLIMVRADSITAREMRGIESAIKRDIPLRVVSDGQRTTEAANAGMPFLLSAPESPISQDVLAIARLMIRLAGGERESAPPKSG